MDSVSLTDKGFFKYLVFSYDGWQIVFFSAHVLLFATITFFYFNLLLFPLLWVVTLPINSQHFFFPDKYNLNS